MLESRVTPFGFEELDSIYLDTLIGQRYNRLIVKIDDGCNKIIVS